MKGFKMRNLKFIEENGKWIIPAFEDYNQFLLRFSGNIYSLTLKKLGRKIGMRSDKLFRILESMGANKIRYVGKVKSILKDDSFYAPTKEVADKIQDWLDDILLSKAIEEKLFS